MDSESRHSLPFELCFFAKLLQVFRIYCTYSLFYKSNDCSNCYRPKNITYHNCLDWRNKMATNTTDTSLNIEQVFWTVMKNRISIQIINPCLSNYPKLIKTRKNQSYNVTILFYRFPSWAHILLKTDIKRSIWRNKLCHH